MLAAFPEFEVVGECRDGREVLSAVETLAPDVLFLDVQMPELGGLDVVRHRSPAASPLVVFLTAYEEFAVDAFDVEAVDYLVKPVSEARFAASVGRLAQRLRGGATKQPPAIAVTTTRGTVVLPLDRVDWIEAADYYSRIWVGPRSYLRRESLAKLERRIARHGFARAHRHALVRVSGVSALRATSEGDLIAILASGVNVPVSRRRRRAFAAALRTQGEGS